MTRVLDRYVLMLLALFTLTGLAIMRGQHATTAEVGRFDLPPRLNGWVGSDGAPEELLPNDPRALVSVRRTYRRAEATAWVVVARYPAQNSPTHRPSVQLIAYEPGATALARETVVVPLDGPSRSLTVNLLSLRRREQRFSIIYWYQLGATTIAGEYELRLRLFLHTLVGRRQGLVLVRLATDGSERPEGLVRAFGPWLMNLVRPEQGLRGHGEAYAATKPSRGCVAMLRLRS